ncbi:hypothetical protein LC593_17600 [Nostoc sp. CHAB 5844]|nr:hypothetical protein [Nostoc sp. CHAB 5844]
MSEIQKISKDVNGITVEQRITDGFINGTAMCVAHGKDIYGMALRKAEILIN